MKFSQIEGLVFWWPVAIRVPDPETAGKFQELGFEAQFLQLTEEATKDMTDRDLLRATVQGWRRIERDDGTPEAFSADGLDRMITNPFTRAGLIAAYLEGLSGVRRKN